MAQVQCAGIGAINSTQAPIIAHFRNHPHRTRSSRWCWPLKQALGFRIGILRTMKLPLCCIFYTFGRMVEGTPGRRGGGASVPFVTLQALDFTNSISVSAHNPRKWNTQHVKNRLSNSKVHWLIHLHIVFEIWQHWRRVQIAQRTRKKLLLFLRYYHHTMISPVRPAWE